MIKNKKLYQLDKNHDTIPRIWRRKACGKQSPRLLVKCGCCSKQIKIYYSTDPLDNLVEINGVCATREQWQTVFREVRLLDD